MPFIETADQASLFVADWGSGPPIVFTHAWGLRSDEWNYQVAALVGLPVVVENLSPCAVLDSRLMALTVRLT